MIAPVLTLRRAWENHYRPFVEPENAEITIRCTECAVKAWERWGPGSLDLRAASAADWAQFKRNAMAEPRAAATINHYLRSHRAILRFMHGEGLIDRIPVIRPASEPEKVGWRPTLEELGRLFRAAAACNPTWPVGPPGYAVDWWQSFIVLGYVGAFRVSEMRGIRHSDCTDAGVELHAPKTKRLSFAPGIPCVRRQVDRMRRWSEPGNPFLLSAGHGHRQFDAARDAIGEVAGFQWWPHGLKRAGVDAWFRVSETAGTIVGHGRKSTACRHYLDRRAYLLEMSPRLVVPPEFSATERQLTLF